MARILIIEDDRMNAIIFEKVLTRMGGHTTTLTENGDEALSLVSGGQVDLVIMDVSLSGTMLNGEAVNGLTLSRTLKLDPRTAHIPILLATAHAMRGDRESLLERSLADEYIAKPVADHRAFCDLISRMISHSGVA